MSNTIKLSLLSVALLSQLNAEQNITLQPIAVTSTAIATDELKSTDSVEVYTQKDIEKAHVQNVYEFLNQQTSITAMPNFGNTFSQLIDMHGYGTSNGYQNVVITINGRKLNNIDGVPQLLSSISPESISKIEIIKSSGIVANGDGANAGVINITTKKSNDKEVSFYMGNYGLFDSSVYIGHKDKKLVISASGETQKSDGIRYIDNNGNKDKNKFTTGTFALSYKALKDLELRLGADFSNIDVIYGKQLTKFQYDNNVKQNVGSTHQLFTTSSLNCGLTYDINDELSFKVDASREKKKSEYLGTYPYTAQYIYDSVKSSLDYINDEVSISAGIDAFYGDRNAGSNKTTKNNIAGFIMSQFYLGNTTLKAGYRYEKVSYKYTDTGKDLKQDDTLHGLELGANYTIDKATSIFLNYAHAYQAPNIDSFFSAPAPTYIIGFNGFISPMKTDNYTIGYNNIQTNNKLKVSFYYINLKNEIYYYNDTINVFPTPSLSTNTNIDKSHKYGFDLYDKYIINQHFNTVMNYNYVQAIIDKEVGRHNEDYSGKKLPGVSNHNIKLTASYLPNDYATLSLTQIYRSKAYAANDFNNNFSQKQDAYMSTDISATYAKDNWEVFAKINNLFNQKNGLWIHDDAIYPVNFTTTAMAGFKLKY